VSDEQLIAIAKSVWPFEGHPPLDIGVEEGVVWAVVKGGFCGVNGYAMIPPEGHPWSVQFPDGASSDRDADHAMKSLRELHTMMKAGVSPEKAMAELGGRTDGHIHGDMDRFLDVHGGVTYYQFPWIGFDTAHGFDIWEGEYENKADRYLSEKYGIPGLHDSKYGIHWTLEKVKDEAKKLARQIAQIRVDSDFAEIAAALEDTNEEAQSSQQDPEKG
jgi:hypothetical protein